MTEPEPINVCQECGLHVQRTIEGTVEDGMREHYRFVHRDLSMPS